MSLVKNALCSSFQILIGNCKLKHSAYFNDSSLNSENNDVSEVQEAFGISFDYFPLSGNYVD